MIQPSWQREAQREGSCVDLRKTSGRAADVTLCSVSRKADYTPTCGWCRVGFGTLGVVHLTTQFVRKRIVFVIVWSVVSGLFEVDF